MSMLVNRIGLTVSTPDTAATSRVTLVENGWEIALDTT
jgi:hypothetical protein